MKAKKLTIPCSEVLMTEIETTCKNLTAIGLSTTPSSLLQVILGQKSSEDLEDEYRKSVAQLAKRPSKKAKNKKVSEDTSNVED